MTAGPILGIDVGDKRVGVALGSAAPYFISPVATYARANGEAERELLELVEQRGVSLIIAGLPLGARGELNDQCSKVQKFCRRLQRRSTVQVQFIDEYASSIEAAEILDSVRSLGNSPASGVDAAAAAVILKRFLERVPVEPSSSSIGKAE